MISSHSSRYYLYQNYDIHHLRKRYTLSGYHHYQRVTNLYFVSIFDNKYRRNCNHFPQSMVSVQSVLFLYADHKNEKCRRYRVTIKAGLNTRDKSTRAERIFALLMESGFIYCISGVSDEAWVTTTTLHVSFLGARARFRIRTFTFRNPWRHIFSGQCPHRRESPSHLFLAWIV